MIAVTANLALQKLGVVAVPLNPGFKRNELEYLLNDADARLIILDPEKKELISDINPGIQQLEVSTQLPYQELDFFKTAPSTPSEITVEPDDPGLIIYTSGTTGNPKGAILTQKNLVHDTQNIISI
ncbi:MAG: class I adenylate-forming enzyme family protein [Thermodesulfobacteriota bacterium]|nr:class I adenylate-forming enzyme family protein [Thermodesulfobacteriota bacterium]